MQSLYMDETELPDHGPSTATGNSDSHTLDVEELSFSCTASSQEADNCESLYITQISHIFIMITF